MIDTYNNNTKIQGHITVECLNSSGDVVDTFTNNNLIMDNARVAMSELLSGKSTALSMNKFVLGTEGHISGNYLTPKTSTEGFISSRLELFSEELSNFNYPIEFTNPGTASGACTIVSETDSGSTIDLKITGTTLEYTINVPELAANNTGITVFTEAALYAGDNIFSMKCFPGKIKDNTVSIRIIWKIIL